MQFQLSYVEVFYASMWSGGSFSDLEGGFTTRNKKLGKYVKHTIHSDEPADVPAIQQTSDDPADVPDTSTPDDLTVHTADVPAERSYRDKAS